MALGFKRFRASTGGYPNTDTAEVKPTPLRLRALVVAVVSVILVANLTAQVVPPQFAATSILDSSAIVAAWVEGEYLPSGAHILVHLTHVRLGVDADASATRIRSVSVNAAPCRMASPVVR